MEEKTFAETYASADTTKGEWHTFGGLVRELGGWKWEPAMLGAKLHFVRAVRMGGEWVKRDTMSNLLMVLRLKPSFQENMEQKWLRFTKFHNEKLGGASAAIQADPEAEPSESAHAIAKPKANPKQKAQAKAKPKPKQTPRGSPTRSASGEEQGAGDNIDAEMSNRKVLALKELNKECQKIKLTSKNFQADGTFLQQAFEQDPKYEWGKNNAEADDALKAVPKIDLTQFETEYLTQSFANLQKRYGVDHLIAEL